MSFTDFECTDRILQENNAVSSGRKNKQRVAVIHVNPDGGKEAMMTLTVAALRAFLDLVIEHSEGSDKSPGDYLWDVLNDAYSKGQTYDAAYAYFRKEGWLDPENEYQLVRERREDAKLYYEELRERAGLNKPADEPEAEAA